MCGWQGGPAGSLNKIHCNRARSSPVMKAHPKQITTCPLAAVDQRLADSHRFWHQAEAAYFDPDGFRLGAQSAIQTLRSVTGAGLSFHWPRFAASSAWGIEARRQKGGGTAASASPPDEGIAPFSAEGSGMTPTWAT